MNNRLYYYGKIVYGSGTLFRTPYLDRFKLQLEQRKDINTVEIYGNYLLADKQYIQNNVKCSKMTISSRYIANIQYVEVTIRFKLNDYSNEEILECIDFINSINELDTKTLLERMSDENKLALSKVIKAYKTTNNVVEVVREKQFDDLSSLDEDIVHYYSYNLSNSLELANAVAKIISKQEEFESIDSVTKLLRGIDNELFEDISDMLTIEKDTKEENNMYQIALCLLEYVAPKAIEMIQRFDLDFSQLRNASKYLVDTTYCTPDKVVDALKNGGNDVVTTVNELCVNLRKDKIQKYLNERVS